MKRKRLKFMNIGDQVLTRREMKSIMAGSGSGGSDYCGNIYCDVGGNQMWFGSGCGDQVMIDSLDNCGLEAALQGSGTTCNGCARFS
ncbi:hypothetical protein NC796_22020 [Aliifodinibius sp. S!AR15-10]|uniref:hypothetical protein n=1 Tax=Aliifodinibius sp. S!AR15-10 TaxID=2950437 RepID=UPI0028659FE6|nr:hypothetical protein [Aliifodinibius sp. S!AR15-10]MDR8393846.1 hypothetical protein [Aliifodinibius sp. S!AR15-10]